MMSMSLILGILSTMHTTESQNKHLENQCIMKLIISRANEEDKYNEQALHLGLTNAGH
jgi:hypothetical protein